MECIKEFFSSIRGEKRVVIASHINSDPDALASSLLIGYLAKTWGIEPVYCTDSISKISRKIVDSLEIPFVVKGTPEKGLPLVVCDTPSVELLGKCAPLVTNSPLICVIDHHTPGSLKKYARYYVVEPEPATSVIVGDLVYNVISRLPRNYATLLITGILFDTKRLSLASPKTFHVLEKLAKDGDYPLALRLLEEEAPYSERMARLKGASRAEIIDVCGYILAITWVSAYEASVARALIGLGADIAIVVGGHKKNVRISLRLSKRALEKGLKGDKILRRVAERIGGVGGGHAAASGYNLLARSSKEGRVKRVIVGKEALIETIREILDGLC